MIYRFSSTPSKVYRVTTGTLTILALFLLGLMVLSVFKEYYIPVGIYSFLFLAVVALRLYIFSSKINEVAVTAQEVIISTQFSEIVIPLSAIADVYAADVISESTLQVMGANMVVGNLPRYFNSNLKNHRFYINNNSNLVCMHTQYYTYQFSCDNPLQLVQAIEENRSLK